MAAWARERTRTFERQAMKQMKETTLTCEAYWLRALDDGAEGDPELAAHLASCESCQAERRVMDDLIETSIEPCSFHLKALTHRVEERRLERQSRRWHPAARATAATAVLLTMAWMTGRFADRQAHTPNAPAVETAAALLPAPEIQTTTAASPLPAAQNHAPGRDPNREASQKLTAQFYGLTDASAVANGSLSHSLAELEGYFDLGI